MREPSIHIKEKDLIGILEIVLSDMDLDIMAIAQDITRRAKSKTLYNRGVSVSNNKLDNKVKTLLKASESDTNLLSNLIYYIRRRKSKLYTTKKIEKCSSEYTQLKELTKVCIEFCNTFNLSKKEGFTRYLELAIPKISSSLRFVLKLINMADTIFQLQEAQLLIDNDTDKVETKLAHDTYVNLIATKTGILNSYIDNPMTYCKFIEVKDITDKLDIPVDIYIKAQFAGLNWTDSFPEPAQLVGDKAIGRLNKYMYENKISTSSNNTEKDNKKNVLLNLKKKYDNNRDK